MKLRPILSCAFKFILILTAGTVLQSFVLPKLSSAQRRHPVCFREETSGLSCFVVLLRPDTTAIKSMERPPLISLGTGSGPQSKIKVILPENICFPLYNADNHRHWRPPGTFSKSLSSNVLAKLDHYYLDLIEKWEHFPWKIWPFLVNFFSKILFISFLINFNLAWYSSSLYE